GFDHVRSLARFAETQRKLVRQGNLLLDSQRLPQGWLDLMRSRGGSVDVVPWDLTYVEANNLSWNPNPVLQTYAAFTEYLDGLSAAHFSGPRAPTFVIVTAVDIDGRHFLWGAPRTWQRLLSGYQVVEIDRARNMLLLQSRPSPA